MSSIFTKETGLIHSGLGRIVQVGEVTLEGHPSIREVESLQGGGFGPSKEAGVQVILMGLSHHCTEPNHGPTVVGCIPG